MKIALVLPVFSRFDNYLEHFNCYRYGNKLLSV